jgi:hypothetical protein
MKLFRKKSDSEIVERLRRVLFSGLNLRFGGRQDRLLIQHFDGGGQLRQDQPPGDEV